MRNTTGTKRFVSKNQLLTIFPVSLSTIDRMLAAGTIPHLRFGRKAVFNIDEVAQALKQ